MLDPGEGRKGLKLEELLKEIAVIAVEGPLPQEVWGITKDSREVREGFLFVVTKTSKAYLGEARKRGAVLFMGDEEIESHGVPFILVSDVRPALGRMAAAFFGFPSRGLHVTGITGTNGKTTTTYLIESLLTAAGKKAGVIGTITYRYGDHVVQGSTTTPESTEIQGILADMKQAGVEYAVMEASSHALDQARVEGVQFDVAIFTNLTHDHLDYHHDFEHYREAKQRLFIDYLPKSSKERKYAIMNLDDPAVGSLMPSEPIIVLTYSTESEADARLLWYEEDIEGLKVGIFLVGREISVTSPLVGMFNVSNILAAALFGYAIGLDDDAIKRGLESLAGVPGRLERVANDRGLHIFVDYAHTPDALKKTLETLNHVKPGRLIVVFGCGGERDRAKRPVMGRIASELADMVIVTSDNPRGEEPVAIIEEIKEGLSSATPFSTLENRKEAIAEGLRLAHEGDTVLIAGKGHEDYQIIKGVKYRFSDREAIEECLRVGA